jgi:hypothetical protein
MGGPQARGSLFQFPGEGGALTDGIATPTNGRRR